MSTPSQPPPPSSILIVGAGVFGLSTTLALLKSPRYTKTKLTLLDPSVPLTIPASSRNQGPTPSTNPPPTYPPPHAASTDTSRIIRPDYAHPTYSALGTLAQNIWRRDYSAPGIYHEVGLVVVASTETGGRGEEYVGRARGNVGGEEGRGRGIQDLGSAEEIRGVLKGAGGGSGERGYVNWGSGWADAGRAMEAVMEEVRGYGSRITMIQNQAERLLFAQPEGEKMQKVIGVRLEGGGEVRANVTILAAGAWTGSLLDLSGIAEARGQCVAYVRLSRKERRRLAGMPVLLDLGTGMFVVPPPPLPLSSSLSSSSERTAREDDDKEEGAGILKIARHGFGYRNPTLVPTLVPTLNNISVSLPSSNYTTLPPEGRRACRAFLEKVIPWLADRAFCEERICWYTDTPTGDFLIDWCPGTEGLFVATGGSGHGFKFLPILGGCVVGVFEEGEEGVREERVNGKGREWGMRAEGEEGAMRRQLRELWRWREPKGNGEVETEDGSRGGRRGMVYAVEMARAGSKL